MYVLDLLQLIYYSVTTSKVCGESDDKFTDRLLLEEVAKESEKTEDPRLRSLIRIIKVSGHVAIDSKGLFNIKIMA